MSADKNIHFHHQVPIIRGALIEALDLAKDAGTDMQIGMINSAIRGIDSYHIHSGVEVDGVEVPIDSFYSRAMVNEMKKYGCE